MESKVRKVFIIIAAFFVTNALMAEFIGVKIFSLEKTLGLNQIDWNILGIEHLSFNLTAGVLLWPFVFVLTDICNEYFGKKGVRLLSYLAMIMIAYAFIMVFLAVKVVPADFWITKPVSARNPQPVNMDIAFNAIFGQGLYIIIGSMVAFLVGQFVDVVSFHWIRKYTGHKYIWIRATGSTLISQFIDSFVVLFIAFYIGAGYELKWVLAVGLVNYTYKAIMAILMTPLVVIVHKWIDNYLGQKVANKLIETAAKQ